MNASISQDERVVVLRAAPIQVALSIGRALGLDVLTPTTIITPDNAYFLRDHDSSAPLLSCDDCGEMTSMAFTGVGRCPRCQSTSLVDITADCARVVHLETGSVLRSA